MNPLQLGRDDLVASYDRLIRHSDRLAVVPADRAVLIESATLRARLGLRMPDAIHVATAAIAGCDLFVINDRRLQLPPGIQRAVL